jgi:hypothetical protein
MPSQTSLPANKSAALLCLIVSCPDQVLQFYHSRFQISWFYSFSCAPALQIFLPHRPRTVTDALRFGATAIMCRSFGKAQAESLGDKRTKTRPGERWYPARRNAPSRGQRPRLQVYSRFTDDRDPRVEAVAGAGGQALR